MNKETTRKKTVQEITLYFTPTQPKPSPRITRSKKTTISPSNSPPLKSPPEPEPDKTKRGHKRKGPSDQQLQPTSPPKNSRMDLPDPEGKSKEVTILDDIKKLISQQSILQKKQLDKHLTKHDERLDQKLDKALTNIN